MKKNYFLSIICLVACLLMGGKAMAESITDVYGTYTFSATMTVADGQDASKLKDNCEVTISKDASNIYLGYIDGIAGSTKGGHAISSYTDGKLVIKNMNDYNTGNFDGGLFFSVKAKSDATKAYNPFGGVEMPDWEMTVDATTGTITIPDFVIVTVSSYEDSLATIVATFTDAKLTLKQKTETDIADVTGNYTYTHGQGTYDCKQDATFSPDYTFTLTKTDDTNKNYTGVFTFDGKYTATLPVTFDGVSVEAAFDNVCLSEADKIYLGNINGNKTGSVTYTYVKAGMLSAYSGLSIVQDSISTENPGGTLQWFINGNAKDESQIKGDEVDFTGTYTVVAQYMDMKDNYSTKDDTFTFTVAKDDNGYYVPQWGEYNDIVWGGLSATVDASDASKLLITPSYLQFISTDAEIEAGTYKYITMTDMNGQFGNIALTKNADGTFSLDQFATANIAYGESSTTDFIRFYSNIISVTKGEEPKPTVTVAGTYKFTGNYCTMEDFAGVVKSFDIKIEENEYYEQYGGNKYLVTEFDGDGIYSINYGGAGATVSDETTFPITITLAAGTLLDAADDCDFSAGVYTYKGLYDMNGADEGTALTITLNEDGTCAITDFSVYHLTFSMETYGYVKDAIIGWYSGSKLVDGINTIAGVKTTSDHALYNLAGQRINKTQRGIVIKDGKKYLQK